MYIISEKAFKDFMINYYLLYNERNKFIYDSLNAFKTCVRLVFYLHFIKIKVVVKIFTHLLKTVENDSVGNDQFYIK